MSNITTVLPEALNAVKRAVHDYRSRPEGERTPAIRAVHTAVVRLIAQLAELEKTEHGATQQAVRGLSEVLVDLPLLQQFLSDKDLLNRLHTRQLALEFIQQIEQHLKTVVDELDLAKTKQHSDWVTNHEVFSALNKAAARKHHVDTYILLFRRGEDESVNLLTRKAKDGRVFTRRRPRDFAQESKIYHDFHKGPAIIGAAIIARNKIEVILGLVPQPAEGQNQLQLLLSISKEAASQPAKDFLAASSILQSVHDLCKAEKIGKDGYILLFTELLPVQQAAETDDCGVSESPMDSAAADDSEESVDESAASDESPDTAASDDSSEPVTADESAEPVASDESAEAIESDESAEPVASDESTETVASNESAEPVASADEPAIGEGQLLVRMTDGGMVITRFRAHEFSDSRVVFQNFGKGRTICGAAVVENNKLKNVFGRVTTPKQGESQLQAVLRESNDAVSKPSREFVAANAILSAVRQLATGDFSAKDSQVVLFVETKGVLTALQVGFNLRDFQTSRSLHDRLRSQSEIVGASVIGDFKVVERAVVASKDGVTRRPSQSSSAPLAPRLVVLEAFGRTPFKKQMLATAELLGRHGIQLPERERPRERDNFRGAHDSRRDRRDR